MKQNNLDYLLSKRTKLKYFVQSQSGNIDALERENFQRIMREEWFGPGYTTDLWCSTCVFNMIKILHQKFEEYMTAEEMRSKAVEALSTAPLPVEHVAASFPKHDGEPREQLNIPTADNSHLHTTSKPKRKKK